MGALVAGFAVGMVVTLLLLRGEGEQPRLGRNLYIYLGGDRCVHLHHWVPGLALAALLTAGSRWVVASAQPCVLFAAGALAGNAAADFVRYSDCFQFAKACSELK